MNLKIFSIIVGALIAVIAVLSGTYYYLFEYSKPKNYTLDANTYTEQKSYSSNYSNSYPSSNQSNNNSTNVNNNIIQKQETNLPDKNQSLNNNTFNTSENNQSLSNDSNTTNISFKFSHDDVNANKNKQNLNTDKEKSKQENNKQIKKETPKKEISKQQKILEREKAVKKELESNKSRKNKYLNTAREYLSIGKNSRLEPELSTENMKVYILDGKFLSQYRINLLKDMLSVIQNNAKDYYLSIFVKLLPKGEMKLTIYNKEIIFSDMKKAYKYISLDKLKPYLNNPKELNEHVAREEILERLKLQIKKDGKGSDFSKHIKSLKTGLNTAQYFFPFCEIIEISSI